jgi:hypothetical protein
VVFQGRVTTVRGASRIEVKGGSENASVSIQSGVKAQILVNDTGGNNTYTLLGGSSTLMNSITTGSGNDTILANEAGVGICFTLKTFHLKTSPDMSPID